MVRRSNMRISRFHKRRGFLVLGLALAVILIASGITLWAMYRLDRIARTGLIRISLDTGTAPVPVTGCGTDIGTLPTTNLLQDASFEPHAFRTSLAVEDGTASVIIVSNKEAESGKYGEGFYAGAEARITMQTDSAVVVKKSARVTRYSPDMIAAFNIVPIRGDIPYGSVISDTAVRDGLVAASGSKGIIITGINTQSPVIASSGINTDLIGICANSSGFIACSEEGVVISSADGNAWEPWISPENISLNAIAASDSAVVAVGDGGRILVGASGILFPKSLGIADDITDIVWADSRFVAVTSLGRILTSSNGILWDIVSQKETSFTRIEYADSVFALLDAAHSISIYKEIGGAPVSVSALTSPVLDIAVVSASKVLALDAGGNIMETKDLGVDWTASDTKPPEKCNLLRMVSDGEILCSFNIQNTYVSHLVTEIELDSPLQSGVFQAGDLCFLSIDYPEAPASLHDSQTAQDTASPWEHYGTGEARRISGTGAPSGGEGIMELSAGREAGGYSVISQKIAAGRDGMDLSAGGFYVFSLWIRQDTISRGTVKVWLSSGSQDPLGTIFSDIGTGWKKYTFKFSFPRNLSILRADDVRLNIGVTGEGTYAIDKAYLGSADEMESSIPSDFAGLMSRISPSIVRTGYLRIGSADASSDSWAHDGSFDTAMGLVLGSGSQAAPWIVVESYASEPELRNLIEYIAGPISSPYGSLRLANGASLPWSSRFTKIYIEFIDSSGVFINDKSRALYVDYSISVIESSPYFENIRSSIVLVDGMPYSEGLMLSGADYSSLGFVCETGENTLENLSGELDRFASLIPRNPERPANAPFCMMKSLAFAESASAGTTADYIVLLLGSLGKDTTATLATLDASSVSDLPAALTAAAGIASKAVSAERAALKAETLSTETNMISYYSFGDGDGRSFVFASHDEKPIAIKLDAAMPKAGSRLRRYDASGMLAEERILKDSGERFNIMPGNVVFIEPLPYAPAR